MIRAKVRSGDCRREAEFDATHWFAKATNKEIVDCWYVGCPVNRIAQFMARLNPKVESVLDYSTLQSEMGFVCRVNEDDVLAWLKVNRSDVLSMRGNNI